MVRKALLCALLSAGCLNTTPPPPAPDSLDGNMRWWYAHVGTATDAELKDAVDKLATAARSDSRTMALKSQMARLAPEDLKEVGLDTTADPSAARGFLMLNPYACTLGRLAEILIAADQPSQYPDVYDFYDRQYQTDLDAFNAGTANTLSWEVSMKCSLPIDDQYDALIKGALRRIPGAAPGGGDVLVYRSSLPSPATFKGNSTSYFRQDYQLEIYWEQEPGKIFHAYGMWREMKVGGFNLTTEDNGMFNLLIDNLEKWDRRTEELCR